ncbi:hypothetical protein MMC12_007964 [Toensbergia leucococca]|nr:hypothetical protein [Toensbergia leucococca]
MASSSQEQHCARCNKAASDIPDGISRCSRCRNTFYCGRECQVADRPTHRANCIAPNAPPPDAAGAPSAAGSSHRDALVATGPGLSFMRSLILQRGFHADPLCDLPHLPNRQDRESQLALYTFLLVADNYQWSSTVQMINYLFHRSSEFIVLSLGITLPAHQLGPSPTEMELRVVSQTLFPTGREAMSARFEELSDMEEPFLGQGVQRGRRFSVEELLLWLRNLADEAGIQLVRNT